uniref:XK-related protein n=1 Tax=Varanus komodoensis TaxID=61221 RepID=A0A8D2IPB2_VARKO
IMRFTKQDFALMAVGVLFFVADIVADIWQATEYFYEEHYLWGTLLLAIGLISSVIIQFFSHAWFKEDTSGNLKWIFLLLHFLHGGLLTWYWFILNSGYKAAFQSNSSGCTIIIHAKVIGEMADISMLRLFKTFLESTPQLILQVYILMISDNCTFSQYVFIAITFGSISCATLDYMIALWKSLPDKNKFTKISSKIMYLFIVLIAGLSTACAIILVVLLWFSIIWVLKQHTAFCKTKAAEIVYRTVVGIILVFTFFNIKGERTKIPMSVYFVSRVFLTLAIMCICIFSKSMFSVQVYLSAVIITVVITLVLGIAFLCVYYGLFHPTIYYTQDVVDGPDAVDGPRGERQETCRIRTFLMQ